MSKALTLAKKKNVKKFRTHGFLARMSTAGGRKTILARLRKGRKRLTVQ